MVSDPRQRLLQQAITRLQAGEPVDQVEGARLEVKEDPSTRDRHGRRSAGEPRSKATADLVRECVVTLANAEGGALLLGVAEAGDVTARFPGTPADGEWICERVWASTGEQRGGLRVSSVELVLNSGGRLLAFLVDPSPFPVPSRDNKFRQRVGRQTREIPPVELGTFSLARVGGGDPGALPSGSGVDDADPLAMSHLRNLLIATGEADRMDLAAQRDAALLRALGLVTDDGTLNQAGELFVVRRRQTYPVLDLIARASVGGATAVRIDRADSPLAEQLVAITDALALLNPEAPAPASALQRSRLRRLPESAVREAIVNAVAHRDWRVPQAIQVIHEGDRLQVTSPGGFMPGIDASNLLTAQPRTRNPILTRTLRGLRLAEAEGSGIDLMYRDMIISGHEPPMITEVQHGTAVRCILDGGAPDLVRLQVLSDLGASASLNVDLAIVLWQLSGTATTTAASLAPALQKTRDETRSTIRLAEEVGLIVATSREGSWRLSDRVRDMLADRLPYLRRERRHYQELIRTHLEQHQEISRKDVIEMTGASEAWAGQILSRALADGIIMLPAGSPTRGRGVRYSRGEDYPDGSAGDA